MDFTAELEQALRTVSDFPKPGIQFKDITPILGHPELLLKAVSQLADPYRDAGITKVVGIEARGFILGSMLASELGAGFVPVRKQGKLPYETVGESYALEYGSDAIEMHVDALHAHDRVLIHDDVIATGGTAAASIRLARRAGAHVAGCAFLIELAFLEGRRKLDADVPVHVVLPL